ncbi:tail-specific protease [Flavobacterium suaedae]|uniref:Tail-specific protease n=1 Tax=Flavobacterium suaedae TaxID=1767027 RepID=A0ABQ1K199_9FLAO|nr:carboxy terminal-processing peptidase [Flavobacterium suaedae]GGB80911.1 tail-specific protease [Flavobacterium suaedae]
MKKFIALAILLCIQATAQNHEKACDIFFRMNSVLQSEHVQPKPVDDSLSVYVFNTVITALDKYRTILVEEDYTKLSVHKYKIDDYINNNQCAFLNDFITTYKTALNRSKTSIEEITASALPLSLNDSIRYSKKAFPFNKDVETNKKFIRKKIIHDILEDIAKQSKNKDSLKVKLTELAPASQEKIKEAALCRINGLLEPSEGFENSMYNQFFSAFCSYFDPHSTYFNYNEKASFMSTVSNENYSLGIYVSLNEKEEVVVEEIVPGGPAYKTSKIDKGDQLLKLAANDSEYTVTCASMEAINDVVFSDSYKDVTLTLRKKDGTVYSVALQKQIMQAYDHSVYSYIIGDNESPIGYIKIPSFYSGADRNGIKGCASDVAKEIVKLKEKNIKGLIVDLQYNGGGSIDEVISLAGMFINYGPVTVISGKSDYKNIVKDYNRGMLYKGPMVVLVNEFSASASEFFAGTMQDYNRAVIVGSTTLGKASMQAIVPLHEGRENNDFIKVTIDKFYRVTGKSNQYIGIVPDVKLPTFYNYLKQRESDMPNAFKNDSLDIHLKYTPLSNNYLKQAVTNSQHRIANDSLFTAMDKINQSIEKVYHEDKKPVAINFDAVFNDVHNNDSLWEDVNTLFETDTKLNVQQVANTNMEELNDTFYKSMDSYKIKLIKNDPYIKEGYNIVTDLYNMQIP